MANIQIKTRRTIVFGLLTAMVLIGCSAFSVQEAFALSLGESARYTILLPLDEMAVYQTYETLGVVRTADGLAYAVTSRTEWYSYVDGIIGTQLLNREIGLALISVDNSKLLLSSIDWRRFDENGKTTMHRVTSVKFKHVRKTAIVDCVAYMLPPEAPEKVTAHFEISDADSISTQRNTLWYYMLYERNYRIGKTYRLYWVYWDHGRKIWGYTYSDMKLTEKTYKTVKAGTFLCYHFEQQYYYPPPGWSAFMQDEYVMVKSKALVYAEDVNVGTYELTGYRPGWN